MDPHEELMKLFSNLASLCNVFSMSMLFGLSIVRLAKLTGVWAVRNGVEIFRGRLVIAFIKDKD